MRNSGHKSFSQISSPCEMTVKCLLPLMCVWRGCEGWDGCGYRCTCLHSTYACACIYMYGAVCGGQRLTSDFLPLSLSTFVFDAESLIKLGAHQFLRPASSRDLLASASPALTLQAYAPTSSFEKQGQGTQTQVLIFAWQLPYWLSHLSAPSF